MRHPVLVAVCLYIAGWLIFEKVLAEPVSNSSEDTATATTTTDRTDRER